MKARQAAELSESICARMLDLPAIAECKSIGIYLSFRNEVQAEKLLAPLVKKGKKVFAPVCDADGISMRFARLENMAETVMGVYSTREPASGEFAGKDEIDAFVVPGLAFDTQCFRIGWGKGYYDAFLPGVKDSLKIGAAYDFQIIESVEADAHDVKMDFVVTEKRTIEA